MCAITSDMNYLNRFHLLIDQNNLCRIGCLDFEICNRKNLNYEKSSSSPMRILLLGMSQFHLSS